MNLTTKLTDFVSQHFVRSPLRSIEAYLQRGAVLDGVPYRDDLGAGTNGEIDFNKDNVSGVFAFPLEIDFRYRNMSSNSSQSLPIVTGCFTNLTYDPFFSATYLGSIFGNLNGPNSSPHDRLVGGVVGGVIGGIAAIAVVAIVIMFVLKVSFVVNFFTPFKNRGQTHEGRGESSTTRSSTWNKAQKPTSA